MNRPGFAVMMERLLSNGVRTIVVETANRFARDLIVQQVGYAMLKSRGITLIAADKPDAFLDDGPTATLIRQVLGAASQLKSRCWSQSSAAPVSASVRPAGGSRVARRLARSIRKSSPRLSNCAASCPNGGQRSLREVAAELAALGHLNASGKRFTPQSIANMLED